MRLADFISDYREAILEDWDAFARSNEPASLAMDGLALRDHAAHMLADIGAELGQQAGQKLTPPDDPGDSAASTHGAARLVSGFTIDQLLAEYRALRASVLRLWSEQGRQGLPTDLDLDDIMRFNATVDQALSEAVARYSTRINHSQHLFLAILGRFGARDLDLLRS